jgi:hypothetical protein
MELNDQEVVFPIASGLTYYVVVELELWSLLYDGSYELTVTYP